MTTRSNEELLDLLLLGLTWVQEETGAPTGWTGNGVLQTMRFLGGLSDQQYFQLARGNKALRDFLEPHAHGLFGRSVGVAQIRQACNSTDKLLVAAVPTRELDGDLLFVPKGYKLAASELGQQRALRAAARYEPYVTHDGFRGQWHSHRRQMRGMNASTRARSDAER